MIHLNRNNIGSKWLEVNILHIIANYVNHGLIWVPDFLTLL